MYVIHIDIWSSGLGATLILWHFYKVSIAEGTVSLTNAHSGRTDYETVFSLHGIKSEVIVSC
jgi:hypothetical protein